ncbi:hypothetical protein OTU49_001466 [Cherax quadricarinatus]
MSEAKTRFMISELPREALQGSHGYQSGSGYTLLSRIPREALHGVLRRLPRQAPQPLPMNSGGFAGAQEGQAMTNVHTLTDTRSGLTSTGVKGVVKDLGKVRGEASALNQNGNVASSFYSGDVAAEGGMYADTQSVAGDDGGAARTGIQGYMGGDGSIVGTVGSASEGKQYLENM